MGGEEFYKASQGDLVEDGSTGGGESSGEGTLLGLLGKLTALIATTVQPATQPKGDVQTKTFTFVRAQEGGDEEDFVAAVASDTKSMGDVLQRVKDKERLLQGASLVRFERERRGKRVDVSKPIDAFKEMEPKIFFDKDVFPHLEFTIT
jgi:hypothetical protein